MPERVVCVCGRDIEISNSQVGTSFPCSYCGATVNMSARVGRLDSQAILDELEAATSQKSMRSKLARAVAERGALIVAGMGLIGFGFWYTAGMPGTFIPLVIITCLILVLIGFAGYRTVQAARDLVGGEVLIETRVLEKTSDFSKPAVATLLSMLSSAQSQTAASHTEFHPEYFVTFEDVGRLLVTKQVWDSRSFDVLGTQSDI